MVEYMISLTEYIVVSPMKKGIELKDASWFESTNQCIATVSSSNAREHKDKVQGR